MEKISSIMGNLEMAKNSIFKCDFSLTFDMDLFLLKSSGNVYILAKLFYIELANRAGSAGQFTHPSGIGGLEELHPGRGAQRQDLRAYSVA